MAALLDSLWLRGQSGQFRLSAQPTSTSKSQLFQVWTTVFSGWFGVGAWCGKIWRNLAQSMFTSVSPKIGYTVYGCIRYILRYLKLWQCLWEKWLEMVMDRWILESLFLAEVRHEVSMGHACRCQTTVVPEKRKGLSMLVHFISLAWCLSSQVELNFTWFMLALSL